MSTFNLKSKWAKVYASHPSYFGIAAIIAAVAILAEVFFHGVTAIIAVNNGNTVSVASSVGRHITSTPVTSLWSPRLDVPTPVRNSVPEIKSADIVRFDPVSEERARAFPTWVVHPFVPAGPFSTERGEAATRPEPDRSKDKVLTPNPKVAARSDRRIPVEVIYQDDAREYLQFEIFYDKCTRDFMPVQCYMPPNFGRDIVFRDY